MTNSVLRGTQTPRIGNFPEYDRSKGDLLIRFAEKIGIPLDEWQKYVIRHMLGEIPDPLNPGKWIWSAADVGLVVPRRNGKTYIIEVLILGGLFLFDENIVLTSQNLKNSKAIFDRIESIILDNPALRELLTSPKDIVHLNGAQLIPLKTGATLEVVARNGKGPRGGGMDRLIMDEAFCVKDEHLAALIPMLSSRPNPQSCWFSTPPLDAVTGEPFTRLRKRGHAGSEGVAWFEWSAPDGADLDDRQVWADANPAFNVRIRESTVARERETLSDFDFGKERLGIWPMSADDNLIKPESWEAIADEVSKRSGDIAIAVDGWGYGRRTKCSVALYGIREDGLGHVEVIGNRSGTDWVVDGLTKFREACKLQGINIVAIALDKKGPVGSVLGDLEKAGFKVSEKPDEPEYGDLAIPNSFDFSAACTQFVTAINDKTIRHTDKATLNKAALGAKTRVLNDVPVWDRYKSPDDISPLVAATLARWAYESRAHLVGSDYDVLQSFF